MRALGLGSAGVVFAPRGGGALLVVVEGDALFVFGQRVLHLRHRRVEKREQTRPASLRELVDGQLALAHRRASLRLDAALGCAVRLDPVVDGGRVRCARARVCEGQLASRVMG